MSFLRSPLAAHVLPFAVFMGFLAVEALCAWLAGFAGLGFLQHSKFVIYPLQTLACALVLLCHRGAYDLHRCGVRGWTVGVAVGLVALAVWVSPQVVFGVPPRLEGFNPDLLADNAGLFWSSLAMRFLRLVVIVPLVEEIFWRGFLMRYLITPSFDSIRVGTWSPMAFGAVAVLFMLEHGTADWPAALVTGILFNLVAVWTGSLRACVIAHAVTNAGLGAYILATKQWGFW